MLAQEIVEDLEAALEQFCEIATDLGAEVRNSPLTVQLCSIFHNCTEPSLNNLTTVYGQNRLPANYEDNGANHGGT
jgi:hypothetical protein